MTFGLFLKSVGVAVIATSAVYLTAKRPGHAKNLAGTLLPVGVEDGHGDRVIRMDSRAQERSGLRLGAIGGASGEAKIEAPGRIEYDPDHFAEIVIPVPGRITAVAVRLGERVGRGAPLATVAAPSLGPAEARYLAMRARAIAERQNADREELLLSRGLTTERAAEMAQSRSQGATAASQAQATALQASAMDVPVSVGPEGLSGTYVLRAPAAGIVAEHAVVRGAYLPAGARAFAVADTSKLWAVVEVPEAEAPYLRPGAGARLRVDAFPEGAIEGVVATIDPMADRASRTVRARVALANPDGRLKAGMYLRATLDAAPPSEGSVILETAALGPSMGESVVFVAVGPESFQVRHVEIGRRSPRVTEVKHGLLAGDRVVVAGAFALSQELSRQ